VDGSDRLLIGGRPNHRLSSRFFLYRPYASTFTTSPRAPKTAAPTGRTRQLSRKTTIQGYLCRTCLVEHPPWKSSAPSHDDCAACFGRNRPRVDARWERRVCSWRSWWPSGRAARLSRPWCTTFMCLKCTCVCARCKQAAYYWRWTTMMGCC
jgi:hypothetical protein